MQGVIDMHVHSHPDVFGRNMDDIDIAQLAKAKGLRGILLKNHVSETASRAALVMKVVPGIEVWGGIVLNKAVRGINPDAVEWMHRVYGSRGKVVWLPTFESDKHVKTLSKPDARGLVVAPGGQVTPEKLVDMGAVIEVCFLQFPAGPNAPLAFLTHWTQVNARNVAQAVKALGAQGLVISSDLGQSGNMTHPDGLEVAIAEMKREGISDADIDIMMRKNPARLLGLSN